MAMLATDFKGLFSITIKPRTDGFTDQYNRIFMVKLLLACTIITGLSWYSDNLNCNMPGATSDHPSSGFVSQSCWVQGLYIYREVRDKYDDSAYFGIPKDLDHDGLVRGHLCATTDKYHGANEICVPMTPTYYLQYQWMPFYLCAIALLYYMPFKTYGTDWMKWSRLNNSMQFDYRGNRESPKPANDLLPPFGYCEFYTSAKDKKNSFGDKHKVLCEVSQFVLYQYTFLILWFAIVVGIVVSAIGVLLLLAHYIMRIGIRHRKMKYITFRQREYLEYIRTKSPVLYGEIVKKLNQRASPVKENGNKMEIPLYDHQQKNMLNSDQSPGLYA